MRRLKYVIALLAMLGYTTLMALSSQAVSAQETGLGEAGLPELDVTATATGFEGIPDETAAGRYLINVTAAEDTGFGGGIAFVQPVGTSAEEFLAAAGGAPEIAGEDPGGTPVLTTEASPAAGPPEGAGAPPAFFFDFAMAGGVFIPAGASSHVVLDLTPGEWVAWGDNPSSPQQPVIFDVTGEMPADLAEPASGATITMGEADEYLIAVTEGELTAGQQVVRVDNAGVQPHVIFVTKGPDGLTEDQVEAVLHAEMTGTPPADEDLDPDEDFVDVLGTGTQSTDTSIWVTMDLEAGTYLLICFFPDAADGAPHAFYGMYTVVEVGE